MSHPMRIFWLLSLLIFLSGCSGYRLSCTTDDQDPGIAGGNLLSACELKIGDKIRINLRDGNRFTGDIQSLSNHEITLKKESGRNKTVVIPAPDILSIEKATSYTAFRAVGMVLVLGAVVVGGITIVNNSTSPKPYKYDPWVW